MLSWAVLATKKPGKGGKIVKGEFRDVHGGDVLMFAKNYFASARAPPAALAAAGGGGAGAPRSSKAASVGAAASTGSSPAPSSTAASASGGGAGVVMVPEPLKSALATFAGVAESLFDPYTAAPDAAIEDKEAKGYVPFAEYSRELAAPVGSASALSGRLTTLDMYEAFGRDKDPSNATLAIFRPDTLYYSDFHGCWLLTSAAELKDIEEYLDLFWKGGATTREQYELFKDS